MGTMKISDVLLGLLDVSDGITAYDIDKYYIQLIKMGYATMNKEFKYVLTDKGREVILKRKLILNK